MLRTAKMDLSVVPVLSQLRKHVFFNLSEGQRISVVRSGSFRGSYFFYSFSVLFLIARNDRAHIIREIVAYVHM